MIFQGFAKWLHRGKENPTILAVHRSPLSGRVVHEVINTVWLRLTIDVDSVHPENLNEQLAFERLPRNVIQVNSGRWVIVPDPNPKLIWTQPERLQRVYILHHQIPQGSGISVFQFDPRNGTLEHFQEQRPRSGISILTQCAHLIGLPFQGVLVSHGQNLGIVQGLTEADEAESVVVREFGLGQSAGISNPLVVDSWRINRSTVWPCICTNGTARTAEAHDLWVSRQV